MIAFTGLVAGQADGNPHHWDRQRRCDNYDYDPPCTICEGIGGIPWGDAPDDITITKCTPVALPDELPKNVTEAYPVFPKVFTMKGHHEVLISEKTNIFCKGGFPGPTSAGPHCYQPQQGSFIYNWDMYSLRMDLNVKSFPYNITTDITHVETDMWIVNDLGLGIHQCICTDPGENIGQVIYPVNWDFMNPAKAELPVKFFGREQLEIEYIGKTMIVDHWTQGPHHVWVDATTRRVVRMYQPWNGLEIWDPEEWYFEDNSSEFTHPPADCIPGSWKWTIKCDKNGMPILPNNTSTEEFLSSN